MSTKAKRRSLMTPKTKGRKSMLGFTNATAKRGSTGAFETPLERRQLNFNSAFNSGAKSRLVGSASVSASGSKRTSRWSTGPTKDTRQLSSKVFQRFMVDEIINFLNESGYPHVITVKILSAPTTKEFLRVFEHLYNFIIPNFTLDQKKYAEEIPTLLKYINFPFQISKSTMFGIGSMHAWPTLLGVLHWLVELIQTCNSIDISQMMFPPALQEDSNIYKELFIRHSAGTYVHFMNGRDEFTEENNAMKLAATHISGCSTEDIDALELEVSAFEEELAELENEPDILADAQKQKADHEDAINRSQQAIIDLDQKNIVLQQQHVQLQSQIKEEGLIVQLGDPIKQGELKLESADIESRLDRLNGEKERLEQLNDEREVRFSRQYNKYSVAATEYNDIATKLSINPEVIKYICDESIMLQFAHSKDGLNDYKYRLKPLLVDLNNKISDKRFELEAKKIEMEEELDKMKEHLSSKRDLDLLRLKDELARMENELKVNKQKQKEYMSSLEALNEMEIFLDKMQKESTDSLEDTKHRLVDKKKECDRISEKQQKEQKSALDSLLAFAQKVEDHKKIVEDQVDMFNSYIQSEIKIVEEDGKSFILLGEQ